MFRFSCRFAILSTFHLLNRTPFTILSYTVSKFARFFLRHSVVQLITVASVIIEHTAFGSWYVSFELLTYIH